MSLSLNFTQKNKLYHSKKPLFFVILVVLIMIAMYIGTSLKTPKISQNLPISYYIELDLDKFNQDAGLWLEDNSNRQKLLDLENQYLETIGFEPSKKLFVGKISLVGISTYFNKIENGQALNQKGTGQAFDRLQDNKENEILFRADISNHQITLDYLKKLGSIKFNEQGIAAITFKQPIFGKNKYYYRIQNKQLTVSSKVDLLNLPNNKIKFPKKNILSALSAESKFLKIFVKSSNISFLNSIMPDTTGPKWIFVEVDPKKLVINFENQIADAQIINNSWLKLIPNTQNIAFFNENINNFLKNYLSDIIPQQALQTFTKDNQSLLILSPKNTNFSINPSDFNYILVVSNSKNFHSHSPEIKGIEQKIKKIFAKKFPTEKITYLPDNSTITELISQPEIFEFQEKNLLASPVSPKARSPRVEADRGGPTGGPQSSQKVANISTVPNNFQTENSRINYLQKPNLEFAYAFFEDKIIFSRSISLLEQVISQNYSQTQNIKNSFADCMGNADIFSDFIFFNPDSSFQQNYGIKKAIITNNKACIY